jgi:hypothetical protein
MSDERNEPRREDGAEPPEPPVAEGAPPVSAAAASSPPLSARRPRSWVALWLAGMLILVIGGVLSSSFWAPAVMPWLPWGEKPAAEKYDALAARIAALEQRPVSPPIDADAIKSAQGALGQRLAAVEAGVDAMHRGQEAATAAKAELAQLTQRVDTIAAQATARSAEQTANIQKMRQELVRRDTAAGEFAARLGALERQMQAQANIDRTGSVELLALSQMREAVADGRPFPAEYAAFKQLTARDPELAAAAEPLADVADDGVASRAVLRQRLADLAEHVGAAAAPPTKLEWWEQALRRLRALVTIRRIDDRAKIGPEATVGAAQSDLAQGDLAGAVALLGRLTGAAAETAQPWLRIARQRLAAEAALTHLRELMTARLGSPAVPSPAATAPPPAPGIAPAAPPTAQKAPS